MRLHENEMPKIDRGWRHIMIGKIVEIEGNTVTLETTLPNLKTRTNTYPLSDASGLKVGDFLDWSEVGSCAVKIWGISPAEHVAEYKAHLKKIQERKEREHAEQ